MNRRTKHSLIAAACAGALVSAQARVARAATGQPFVYVQTLASTSPSGPFTASLSDITPNSTVYFEVTDVLAPIGTVNLTHTITSESPTTGLSTSDGINSAAFNLTASGTSIATAALSTSPVNFSSGSTASQGTISSGNLSTALPSAGVTSATPHITIYDGAVAGSPLDVMETGNISFSGNGNITGSFASSQTTAISVNTGGSHIVATTSYFNFGNPLLLSTASTAAWTGTNGGTWTTSGNFNGSGYTNATGLSATPVSFGDGVTTSTVSIPGGGVTPFSVAFSNSTATTYSFSGADSTGISGTTPVTLNGTGTVKFTSPNTYSGITTINAGTLRANNGATGSATGTSNIYVNSGGMLGGTGNVSGTVGLASGGNITAGVDATHAGSLITGQEYWGAGSSYTWKINDLPSPSTGTAGTNWDLLTMNALIVPVSPASPITISLQSAGGATPTLGTAANNFGNGVYKIASITSFTNIPGITGNSTATVILTGPNANGADSGLFTLNTANFANDPSDQSTYLEFIGSGTGFAGSLDLVYSSAPEPATSMLALCAVGPILLRRRRRKSAGAT